MNRRHFLKKTSCILPLVRTRGSPFAQAGENILEGNEAAEGASAERRPVLYNGDTDWFYYSGPERIDRDYLEGLLDRRAAAGVTIFSETAYDGGRCLYDTKVGDRFDLDRTYVYCPEVAPFSELYRWRKTMNFRRLLAEGNEPLRVFIETSHKRGLRFLGCLRMNDRHPFNIQHPPTLLERYPAMAMKREDGSLIGGMDFQYSEVREFLFKPMEELATNYDVDGLELDWMRWVQMFSATVPTSTRLSILTDYHRRIRGMLDEVGKRKGKHLLLSVRVPPTLAECDALGFDVAAYIKEGLIDILCPSDFYVLDPRLRVEDFKALTAKSEVLLMPSVHMSAGRRAGFATTEEIRAVAHSYYRQGADGISVYNWFEPSEWEWPEKFQVLRELGAPAILADKPREYLFNPMWGGKSETGRVIDWKAAVPRSPVSRRVSLPIFIREDPRKAHIVLDFKLEGLTLRDDIQIDINGHQVESERMQVRYSAVGKRDIGRFMDSSWASGPYYLYRIDDAQRLLNDGANDLGITLVHANSGLSLPIVLFETRVRVHVR